MEEALNVGLHKSLTLHQIEFDTYTGLVIRQQHFHQPRIEGGDPARILAFECPIPTVDIGSPNAASLSIYWLATCE